MKLFIYSLTLAAATAAVEKDLRKGVDFTGRTAFTGTAANQLVDNATLNTNRGLLLRQVYTPDLANNPRQTNYLWIDDTIPGAPVLKVWNGTTWTNSLSSTIITTANIADGSVTSVKLGLGAVTTERINSGAVGSIQLANGAVTTDKYSDASITRPKLVDGVIDSTKLTNGAVLAANIADATITSGKISTIDAVTITNLSNYVNLKNAQIGYTNLPAASANQALRTGISDGTWTNVPISTIVYIDMANTNMGVAGVIANMPHSLGRVPYNWSAVYEITNAAIGYNIGDEFALDTFVHTNVLYRVQILHASVTATSVVIRADSSYYNATNNVNVPHGTVGSEYRIFPTTIYNWGRVKFYLQ
jgi:hypothetical protein